MINLMELGNLNILKWLRENGCPWDEKTWIIANEKKHLNIIEYLKENNCPQ